jgi:hypothetical protein
LERRRRFALKNQGEILPTKRTFKDICDTHQLKLENLIGIAGRYEGAIIQMLGNKPVHKAYAEAVLEVVSTHTGQDYTLDNVAVNLADEEGTRR